MAEDLSHTYLTMTRKQLTLALRTLVTRDLCRHRTQLITRYLRQHGIPQDWDAFLTQAGTAHQRAMGERLTHDTGYRRLTQAKAELDLVLTTRRYAECTSPLLTDGLRATALRLMTHRLTFAEDQYADAAHAYVRELWEEQRDYYRELQGVLHHRVYDVAVALTQAGDGPRSADPEDGPAPGAYPRHQN
jgi:hypothetical protein